MLYVKKRTIALYILPALVILTAFVFFPILLNFVYALFRWSSFPPSGNSLERITL